MATLTEDEVLSALKQCYDPEIPVNIVDLGLIYGVRFDPAPEEKQDVTVEMTLTAQGCPLARPDRRTGQGPRGTDARCAQRHGERGLDSALDPRAAQPRRPQDSRHRVTTSQSSAGVPLSRGRPALGSGN